MDDKTASGALHSTLETAYRIDELISEGQFAPGQRLVEPELAAELQISRGAVREALRYLAGDGVVELLPNRGARIRKIQISEVVDMMEVLTVLFRKAIELLAQRPLSDSEKTELHAAAARIEFAASQSDKLEISRGMTNFVLLATGMCGNGFLRDTVRRTHLKFFNRTVSAAQELSILQTAARTYPKIVSLTVEGRGVEAAQMLGQQTEIALAHLKGR